MAAEVSNSESDVEWSDSGDEVDGAYGFPDDVRPLDGSTEAMTGLLYFVVSVYLCMYLCVCACVCGVNRPAERWWLAAVSTCCSRMLLPQGFQNNVK